MTLDCSALFRALKALEEAIAIDRTPIVRDAVIQRFKLTYELAWKSLQRALIDSEGHEAIEALSRRELFRLAARRGLIEDAERWFDHHLARNEWLLTYDDSKADEVAKLAESFAVDARTLLTELETRHA